MPFSLIANHIKDLNENNVENINLAIQEAINFEIMLLKSKLNNNIQITDDYIRRIELLSLRK